jgi:hypothetical protein
MGSVALASPKVAMPVVPAPPPPPGAAMDVDGGMPSVEIKPTGERALLESKLHPAVLQAFDCWKQSGQNCTLAADGILELQLWLTDATDPVVAQLTALGFVESRPRSHERVLVGRLPVAKLADLAKINAVRFVSPLRR